MKIVISATGKEKDSLLDGRFGRCEYFHIYNTDNDEVKIVENEGQKLSGGAGISAAQQLIDEKVDVVITGNLGPNAYKLIDKAQIKAYRCESVAMQSAIEKLNNNELEEITFAGKAHHGMGR